MRTDKLQEKLAELDEMLLTNEAREGLVWLAGYLAAAHETGLDLIGPAARERLDEIERVAATPKCICTHDLDEDAKEQLHGWVVTVGDWRYRQMWSKSECPVHGAADWPLSPAPF